MRLLFIIFGFLLILMGYYYTNADGSYSKELNLILVYPKDLNVDRLLYVASHEIGHYVYYKDMTADERNTYIKLYNDSNIKITEYSKVNDAENFAEEFAARISCTINKDGGSLDRNAFFDANVYKYILTGDDVNGSE